MVTVQRPNPPETTVASTIIELHDALGRWLEAAAQKRHVSVECAIVQLLEEERMRSTGATKLDVSIGGEQWAARMPMRGLLYSGYETEWTRVATQ
jgi:hypothetical protein